MKVPNFTAWFIIAVFIIGTISIFIYEHFRYSPFALTVDFEVFKEYIFDRHVDCYNVDFRNKFRSKLITFSNRLSPYEFSISVAFILSVFQDGVTRIEFPIKKTDKVLPVEFKYISNEVVVSKVFSNLSLNLSSNLKQAGQQSKDKDATNVQHSLETGAKILAINGIPIEQILEKYSMLNPNLSNYEAKYSFVDKLLPYFLKIIGANSVRIDYQPLNSSTIASAYLKGVEKFETLQLQEVDKPLFYVFNFKDIVVIKVNSFKISNKEDMAYVSEELEKIAYNATEDTKIIFDLRYAKDGDETLPILILSYLISEPRILYPKLYIRHKDKLILKEQLPIIPADKKIKGQVYFIVDSTCFYKPHKVLIGFLSENSIATIVSTDREFQVPTVFYLDEFWRILPNTRGYIVLPTSKVVLSKIPEVIVEENLAISVEELISIEKYKNYLANKLVYFISGY